MKCKQHPYEPAVGVCASCLRERLLALIAAQNEAATVADEPPLPPAAAPLPPLIFPRSVSPYVAPHRRSLQRFFSTPQVGPTFEASVSGGSAAARRPSLFSSLFGHRRSGDADSKSGSWISGLIRRHRKKSHPVAPGRRWCDDERGMSPTRDNESGCSTSPAWWRRSSASATPMRRSSASGVSGFSVCLSPMVRACPAGGRRCGGGEVVGVSGELRVLPNRHGSLGPNRSRKIADFGRFR